MTDTELSDGAKKLVAVAHEDERKLFVGGLPNETKHEDVKVHFSSFGNVEKVKLMSDQVTGRFKGFGFVVFEEVSSCNAALAQTEQVILGRTVTVKRATVKVKQGKIYIGKLPIEGMTEDDIRTHFSQFGTVVEVVRPVDKTKNDEPKPFAFVTFAREEIAKQLVKLGGDVLNGHKFNIKSVIIKDQTQGPGGMMPGHPMAGVPPRPGMGAVTPGPWGVPPGGPHYGGQYPAPHAYGQPPPYGGYPGADASYGGSYGASHSGYGTSQGATAYYGAAPPAPPPPPAAPAPGTGVPSLATFNPYDISSYGGGKIRTGATAQQPHGGRPQPY